MARPGELFVMARVPGAVREALLRALAIGGLDARLGGALYPPRNWHQTLSDLQPPASLEAMRRACAGLEAHAFQLRFDQVRSSGSEAGRIHWEFLPSHGKPEGLALLLAEVQDRLRAQGIGHVHGHRAHVTVSYSASQGIGTLAIPAVDWLLDTIELVQVAGRGKDYRYETVEAWPLRAPPAPPALQLGLL